MSARPVVMWAPIVKPKRGREWVCVTRMGSTKKEARKAMLKFIPESRADEFLRGVRFARVQITEITELETQG